MRIGVVTLGCKVNQCESTEIIFRLKQLGHDAVSFFSPADIYIINTCSVTSEADKKSRQMISRVLKFNPAAKVIIAGCSSQNNADSYKSKSNVVAVVGTDNKISRVVEFVHNICNNDKINNVDTINNDTINNDTINNENASFVLSEKGGDRARVHIKIQDGCNNFCSYCIVPYLRGRSRSRSIADIVSEAQNLAKMTEEIVLTGINISAFCDEGKGLVDLVMALKDVPVQKRLGSLECNVITSELLVAMRKSNFCDHFHLSLQSGCSRVLQLMNRHYTPKEFLQKVELIRSFFPFAGITTDVICGFPTETDDDHAQTLEFLQQAAFSDIHVFPYSVRQGTKAAEMQQVKRAVSEKRASELNTLKNSLKLDFFEKNRNRELKVFIEDSEGDFNCGYTSNYIKVYSNAPRHSFFAHVLCDIKDANGMMGKPIAN